MTVECTVNVTYGGAKAVSVSIEPLSRNELHATRRYTSEISMIIGPNKDIRRRTQH